MIIYPTYQFLYKGRNLRGEFLLLYFIFFCSINAVLNLERKSVLKSIFIVLQKINNLEDFVDTSKISRFQPLNANT